MSPIAYVLAVAVAIPLWLLSVRVKARNRGESFTMERGARVARFRTKAVTVTFHRERDQLRIERGDQPPRTFSIDDVARFELRRDRSDAPEYVDDSLIERLPAYRDQEHRRTVTLVTTSGLREPLLETVQHEVKDFMDASTGVGLRILEALGLWRDARAVADDAVRELEATVEWCRADDR